jgi:hypothetical protein
MGNVQLLRKSRSASALQIEWTTRRAIRLHRFLFSGAILPSEQRPDYC